MDKNAIPSRSLSRRSKILLLIAGILIGILATEAVSRLVLWRLQQSHGHRIYDHFYFDQNEISKPDRILQLIELAGRSTTIQNRL